MPIMMRRSGMNLRGAALSLHGLIAAAAVAVFFCSTAPQQSQAADVAPPVNAKLLSAQTAIIPGSSTEVGVLLEMAHGWHTYWAYSGDAGFPTKVEWTLPEGFKAGPIEWPTPEGILEPGDIMTYAYGGRVLLITKIEVPQGASGKAKIKAKVSWLACNELCVPGSADVELTLPAANSASPANAELFSTVRSQLPADSLPPYSLSWSRSGKFLQLDIGGLPAGMNAELFPLPAQGEAVGHLQTISPGTLRIEAEDPFHGVLAVGAGQPRKSWLVSNQSPQSASSHPIGRCPNSYDRPLLWISWRTDPELDAVRTPSHLAENFRFHQTVQRRSKEDPFPRHRLHGRDLRLVHRTGVTGHRAKVRGLGGHVGFPISKPLVQYRNRQPSLRFCAESLRRI